MTVTPLRAGGARRPERLWPLLRTLGGLAVLAVLVAKLGTGAFVAAVSAIEPTTVLLALGIGVVSTVATAARWCLVTRALGLRLTLPGAVANCYRALFLNAVLPAGVLGDVHRAVQHGRESGDVGRGIRAVVLERAAGQLVLVAVGLAVLLARPNLLLAVAADLAPNGAGTAAVLGGACAVVAVGLCWLIRARRAAPVRQAIARALATLRTDVRDTVGHRGTGPVVALLSLIAVAGYVATFAVAARAVGVTVPVVTLLPLVVLALFAMSIPITIGGWGPREAVTAVAFGAAGLGATQGLAVAVGYGTLSLIACLPGAGVLVRDALTGRLRRRAPGSPALPPPSPRMPVMADRRSRNGCSRPSPTSAGGGGHRRDDPLLRIPA